MTQTDTINASLLTAGSALIGEGLLVLHTNVWVGVALIVIGALVFTLREILP